MKLRSQHGGLSLPKLVKKRKRYGSGGKLAVPRRERRLLAG